MEKEIFEDGKETDDFSVKKYLISILGCFLGLGVTVGIHFGMEHLQDVTFASSNTVIVASFPNGVFFLLTLMILLIFVGQFTEKITKKKNLFTKVELLVRIVPMLIFYIPLIYFTFDHYVTFSKEAINFDPLWTTEKQEYLWEDIESVVIYKPLNSVGDYEIYFHDGTKIDLWKGGAGLNIYELNSVDDIIINKGIPKYINGMPTDKQIKKAYSESEEFEMAKKIFTE